VLAQPSARLAGALVQADSTPALHPNYIASLLAARDLNAIRDEQIPLPSPKTLLYLLLRHSMLLEYANGAARVLIKRGLLTPELRREAEFVDLPPGQSTQTVWRQLAGTITVPGTPNQIALGTYLLGFNPSGEPDLANEPELQPISDFRASLTYLQ